MEPWSWEDEEAGGVRGVHMDQQLDDSQRDEQPITFSKNPRPWDPEIQQESQDFISTNHLASMKANWTILISQIVLFGLSSPWQK